MFEVGTVLAGKYRVDRVIGRGGMGMVVAATHLHLYQPVALKFLLPDLAGAPLIVERFVREARASAQLRGEHVCRVSDVGTFEGGAPYIVMELLDGSDLASALHHGGPMAVQRAADHVLQACVGVAEAHALGIVHRDLKPANLFLTTRPDGTPLIKVLDFGIAKAQNEQSFSLTQTNVVLGSPGYMSPEQLRSTRNADVRSDIWSIGVILYELVTGRPPFTGESVTELALHIAMDPTPPMLDGMPPGFEAVVQRCLAKDPAQRYADLAELAQALVPYAGLQGRDHAAAVARQLRVGRSGAHATGGGDAPVPAVPSYASTPTTMGAAASSMRITGAGRRRWGVIAGAAATVLAGAIATIVLAGGGHKATAADPSVGIAAVPAAGLDAGAAFDAGAALDAGMPDAGALDAGAVDVVPVDASPADLPRPQKPVRNPKVPSTPKQPASKPRPDPGVDLGNSRF